MQRIGGFVTTTTANLHGVIDDLPRALAAPEFCDRGLEAHVGMFVTVHERGDVADGGLHGEAVCGHARELVGDGGVPADGLAPLLALLRPACRDVETALGKARAGCGQGDAPGVQSGERDLQSFAFAAEDVFLWHTHVLETDDTVVEGAQAHEMAAVQHLDARPLGLDDECRRGVWLLWRGGLRHHDDQAGLGAVCAPELVAIENVMLAIGIQFCRRGHAGRIAADVRFSECECRNLAHGAAGQIFLLLLLGSEENQWLRRADGLMGGEQRGEVAAHATEKHGGARVVGLRESQPAVLGGNLDAEGSERGQLAKEFVRDFSVAINCIRIGMFVEQTLQAQNERISLIAILDRLFWERQERSEIRFTEENASSEALVLPFIARGLSHFQCGPLAGRHL